MPAPSAPPSLTAPPTAPSRNDAPPTFISRMNAFLAWIITFVSEMGTMATALYAYATSSYTDAATANTKAGEAAASASDASDAADIATTKAGEATTILEQIENIADGISFTSTSTTSLTVGTGSKTFTVQAGESYAEGMPIAAVKNGDPTVYMVGICTAYSGTSLTVAVSQKSGSGTVADWNISVGGIPGPQPPLATSSEVAALSDQTKAVSAGALGDALAPVDDGTGSGSYSPNITTSGFHIRRANGTSTLAAPTGGKPGQSFYFELGQDGIGSRAWSFDGGYKFFGGTPSSSTAANAIDAVSGIIKSVSPFESRCAYLKGASS